MAKVREKACIYYICEKECLKNREGTFYGYCQKCDKYQAKAGSKPARTDLRRKKMNDIQRKERYDY